MDDAKRIRVLEAKVAALSSVIAGVASLQEADDKVRESLKDDTDQMDAEEFQREVQSFTAYSDLKEIAKAFSHMVNSIETVPNSKIYNQRSIVGCYAELLENAYLFNSKLLDGYPK